MDKTISLKPLTNEALASLFLSMAMKEDDRLEAERAFSEYHNRYKDYLFTVVKKACRSWSIYGDELIEGVFRNTFLTVYEKAESFMIIEDLAIERQELRMKSWLGKIAKNEMFKLLRDFKDDKEKIEFFDDLSFLKVKEENPEVLESTEYLLAEKALNSLSERDRNILVTYLMFEDGNKKLPSDEIQRLADLWDVHPDNLRQIKKRSLAKVKMYIETIKKQ